MKKEHILMLVAGFVLGAVVCFIVMKQQAAQQPAPAPIQAAQPTGTQGAAQQPVYDPNQHMATLAQYIAQAKADPKDAASRISLGNIYYDIGKYAEAAPWYEEAIRLQPTNTDATVDLGVCYHNLGQNEKAIALFDQALKLDPVKKQPLMNRVIVYGTAGLNDKAKSEAALRDFEKAYPGDPAIPQLKEMIPH